MSPVDSKATQAPLLGRHYDKTPQDVLIIAVKQEAQKSNYVLASETIA